MTRPSTRRRCPRWRCRTATVSSASRAGNRCHFARGASHRGDELLPCVRQRLATRLEQMPGEEEAGEGEALAERGGRRRADGGIAEEFRQCQELVPPRLAGRTRHRAPTLRRHIGEIGSRPRRRAFGKIKAESKFGKKPQFESG